MKFSPNISLPSSRIYNNISLPNLSHMLERMRHFILIYKTLKQTGFVCPKDFGDPAIINIHPVREHGDVFSPYYKKTHTSVRGLEMARI